MVYQRSSINVGLPGRRYPEPRDCAVSVRVVILLRRSAKQSMAAYLVDTFPGCLGMMPQYSNKA